MDSNEKNPFERTNQFYIAQVNSMEIKISELKAQLHAKDFEIDYLSSKLSASQRDNGKSRDWHEIEMKLKIATQENEILKSKISEFQDVHIIKSQLEQALHMKKLFESKYRELKSKIMVDEKALELTPDKEKIRNLEQDLENAQKVIEENSLKLKETYTEINELKKELYQKETELQELRKISNSVSKSNKTDIVKNWLPASPNTAIRTVSANQTRKNSPNINQFKGNTLHSNIQYHSPKPVTEYIIRPKIVSISLESTLNPPPN